MSNRRLEEKLQLGESNDYATLGIKIGNAIETSVSVASYSLYGSKRSKHEISQAILSPEFVNGKFMSK